MPEYLTGLVARQLFYLSEDHFDGSGLTVTTLHLACEMQIYFFCSKVPKTEH